jgi:multimeric flavodoxin WrbA
MKILAVNGSPRRERSNTGCLLKPMIEAAQAAGAEVEHIYLSDLDVRPCTGCISCWTKTPGQCVQNDDGAAMLERLRGADVFILGFPLYIYSVPARVQAFLERLLPTVEPWLVHDGDTTHHPVRKDAWPREWVILSNCGFPEQSHFDALQVKYAHLGIEPVCMAAGALVSYFMRSPELAPAWDALRGTLEQAGRELALAGHLSDETRAQLNRPLTEWAGMTPEQYDNAANESFRRALDASGHKTE